MRIARNLVIFGACAIMFTAIVALMALWVWAPVGGGPRSSTGLTWNVEYWQQDADGQVLQHRQAHNAIVANGLEQAVERLIAAGDADAALAFGNPAASEIGEANAFDQIVLMNADDDASDGLLASNILLLVDGGTGNNAGQAAGGAVNNPADGTYVNVGDATDGDGSVVLQFLADGDPVPATQMHLVKAAVNDTSAGGAVAIAAEDILATIEIDVDLADTDTLTVTWTIDVE